MITRPYGPKKADHPTVGTECPACHVAFVAGDWTTLVPIGPGADPESQHKARNGWAYNAVEIEAHWTCVTGEVFPDA